MSVTSDKLDMRWTKGLDKEFEIELRQNIKESIVMRKRLAVILAEAIKSSEAHCRSKLAYDSPNWALLQADQRGYQRAMDEILSLITK